MTLSELVAARLAALGWTQADLARAAGIPKQNLSPMLRGLRPVRAHHALVLDCVLGLGLDYGACRWEGGQDGV